MVNLIPIVFTFDDNLIINSKKIKEDNIIPLFRELAKRDFHQQDMDIINIACYGKIKPLSPAFSIVKRRNLMLSYFSSEDLKNALDRDIIHYNGAKPWKEFCANFDIWWEYYRKSPFFDSTYYFDFSHEKLDEYDRLPLLKRVKILLRCFLFKK